MTEPDEPTPGSPTRPPAATDRLVAEERGRLFGLAYRMLGSAAEAEDIVQETFLRWASADRATIDNPGGWLTTVCARLCIDRLRSARRRRETYVGPWLPEPLLGTTDDPADAAEAADTLSLAFLAVLERLSPLERAVFLLHDVFGHPHERVAAMLDRRPAAVRQLASRARRHIEQQRPRFDSDPAQRDEVAHAFLDAAAGGDLDRLLELLSPDVVFVGDGGGVVTSVPKPVHGADRVARLLLGLRRQTPADADMRVVRVNGAPAAAVTVDGSLDSLVSVEVAGGRVTAVNVVRNPDKLARLDRDLALTRE